MLTPEEKDKLFLVYAARKSFKIDPVLGKVFKSNGDEIGSRTRKRISLCFFHNGKIYGIARSRVIWLHVHGFVPEGYDVGHDQSIHDDNINNLQLSNRFIRSKKAANKDTWSLKKENRKIFSILNEEMVNEARRMKRDDQTLSYETIAKKFNVARKTISEAIQGKTWQNATETPVASIPLIIKIKEPKIKKERKKSEKSLRDSNEIKIIESLLRNNSKLSTSGIRKFLKMRNINMTEKKLNKIIEKILERINN